MATVSYQLLPSANASPLQSNGAPGGNTPSIAALAGGGFIATSTAGAPYPSYGVIRYDNGALVTPQAFGLSTNVGGTALDTQVTGLVGGGAVAVFGNATGHIGAHLFDANGNPVANEFILDNNMNFDGLPDVAGLNDGGFVVAWEHKASLADDDIYAKVFNSDGSTRANVVIAATVNSESDSHVAALANGGFAATWIKVVGAETEIWAARYDANGIPQGSAQLVDTVGTLNDQPDIVGLRNGGFAIAYRDNGWPSGNGTDITLVTFDANGTKNPYALANQGFTGGDQQQPAITTLSNGYIAVGWQTANGAPNDTTDLAIFDQDGNFVFSDAALFANHSSELALAGLARGNLAAVFLDESSAQPASDYKIVRLVRSTVGTNGNDTLTGDDLRDGFNGGPGADTMIGGGGDDGYAVDNAGDQVVEQPGEGLDYVQASIDYTVPANVEQLMLSPNMGPLNGTGNDQDDQIFGNKDNNVLNGLAGKDILFGDFGNDVLHGGQGNDRLTGGPGDDLFDGGVDDDTAIFSHTFNEYAVMDFGAKIMIVGPDGTDTVTSIEHVKFADVTINPADYLDGNPLFDALYYLSRNGDVFHAGVNALDHFNTNGWHEGRDPNAFFSVDQYLGANPDVKASGANPFEHYHQAGWQQGRDPGAAFDTTLYLIHNPDVAAAGIDPLAHYLSNGFAEGRAAYQAIGQNITGGFDAEYYLFHNPDVAAAGIDPLTHFNVNGWHEGRNPNAWFDTAGYLAHYADVSAANINPLTHYELAGWLEGRDPSAGFDTLGYLAVNPDVAAAHVNPLDHFLQAGIFEGRAAVNDGVWH